ncbi:hypothetical protein K438DRAFT_1827723 [Mycena galopus ATCC 62051]|nr:hypothetical protein K438DRAFT_1827723 [Mycena galopus ATCC 62051]
MVVAKYAAKFKPQNLVFLIISPGLATTSMATKLNMMGPVLGKIALDFKGHITLGESVKMQLKVFTRTVEKTRVPLCFGNKQSCVVPSEEVELQEGGRF